MARLYLSEEALLNKDIKYAKQQAQAALQGLPKGSAGWTRAQDILAFIEAGKDKNPETGDTDSDREKDTGKNIRDTGAHGDEPPQRP